jgi:hypothetical protein
MDEGDFTVICAVLGIIVLAGLAGWVLLELGIYLHGLNSW